MMRARATRTVVIVACIAACVAAMTGCAAEEVPVVPTDPTTRQIGIGFEDVVAETDWAAVEARLERVDANAVSVSAGRVEWTAFPWDAHPEASSALVAASGRDFLAEAIEALRTDAAGAEREVTVSIDALVPRLIEEDPALAGVSTTGTASESFASASALEGEVGDRIVEFAAAIAERHRPDEIGLTELMFDGSTYGRDDLASYRSATGEHDWPRALDGSIATGDERIARWRSEVIAGLVERVADAVHPWGVSLAVDVRVDPEDPAAGRPESGHDYAMLASVADRLILWNHVGQQSQGASVSPRLTSSLSAAGVEADAVLVQVGMWREDESQPIAAPMLADALRLSATNGVAAVGVTPMSLLDDAAWAAIERTWR